MRNLSKSHTADISISIWSMFINIPRLEAIDDFCDTLDDTKTMLVELLLRYHTIFFKGV